MCTDRYKKVKKKTFTIISSTPHYELFTFVGIAVDKRLI